jgi:hypothetical protein
VDSLTVTVASGIKISFGSGGRVVAQEKSMNDGPDPTQTDVDYSILPSLTTQPATERVIEIKTGFPAIQPME